MATTLELTPAETQVAVWLAEGKRVRDMAKATGHTDAAIYWHLQRIYQKHSLTAVSRKEHRPEGPRITVTPGHASVELTRTSASPTDRRPMLGVVSPRSPRVPVAPAPSP